MLKSWTCLSGSPRASAAIDELEVSTATQDEIVSKLERGDYIYVSGGNTFFLLQELKRTGADLLIAEHVRAGKCYIGESAGSAILAPSIEYITALDDVSAAPDLESFAALGLVDSTRCRITETSRLPRLSSRC
ncbi:Type 1 glutamine amidotransferase-like domain-containing protein [Stutzerimonas sp. FeSN7]|uniref:Type 1 glutamine amidotransferase-like domain-containing protein n=1 Tax=Stutzerimonas sp. FeSN7 TaxID=3035479 RepID=UPI0025578072|nr:Type 1 glutamine amidotransferase-like domain-containing protein [Stutzerimonas sp. FeSN7]MDL2176933.1 Type 1 glutamine amidotransferase-like domain-containing protein [Stutzerimonas sp. FeSN7]